MIEVYRKRKASLDSAWHFHTQCPDWPENDFIQTRYLKPDELEGICPECCKVNAKMFPTKSAQKKTEVDRRRARDLPH
jgi:hypothetical protein